MNEEEKNLLLEWEMILKNITDFAVVKRINGIKFEVRTDEQSGHHRPHLHVSTSSASLSIAIDDGEILAKSGKISPPQIKMAKEWMEKNREFISNKWNEFSNGIEIPIPA
nr:DUF4160 domain-containing protein [uncultured Ruminococcus sp.]